MSPPRWFRGPVIAVMGALMCCLNTPGAYGAGAGLMLLGFILAMDDL